MKQELLSLSQQNLIRSSIDLFPKINKIIKLFKEKMTMKLMKKAKVYY